MKLVLAGSRRAYDKFLHILDYHNKYPCNYRYISHARDIRGYPRETQIIKLANFSQHPQHDEILEYAKERFDMRTLRERRAEEPRWDGRLSSEDVLRPRAGTITYVGTPPRWESSTAYAPSEESLTIERMQEAIENMQRQIDESVGISPLIAPSSQISVEGLRGMHFDSVTIDESVNLPFQRAMDDRIDAMRHQIYDSQIFGSVADWGDSDE